MCICRKFFIDLLDGTDRSGKRASVVEMCIRDRLLLEDIELWKRRGYQLQAEKKKSHTDNIISVIVSVISVSYTHLHNLMKIFYVLLDLYERVEDEQAKDGCMENKQVKDAAEDALGLDLTDMAKMYPGGFLLELSETIDGIEQTLQYSIEERNELLLDLAENYRREGSVSYTHLMLRSR